MHGTNLLKCDMLTVCQFCVTAAAMQGDIMSQGILSHLSTGMHEASAGKEQVG